MARRSLDAVAAAVFPHGDCRIRLILRKGAKMKTRRQFASIVLASLGIFLLSAGCEKRDKEVHRYRARQPRTQPYHSNRTDTRDGNARSSHSTRSQQPSHSDHPSRSESTESSTRTRHHVTHTDHSDRTSERSTKSTQSEHRTRTDD